MTENIFTELLGKKLAGEITPQELEEFNRLLANNKSYIQEYHTLNSYFAEDDKPYDNIEAIFSKIRSKTDINEWEPTSLREITTNNNRSVRLKQVAAILIIMCISAGVYTWFTKQKQVDLQTQLSWKKLITPSSSTSRIKLSDGTQITLNSESELNYPVSFNRNTREVYLNGEAYFEVAKDHAHPFIVHTNKYDVKVLGTAFNVKAYDTDSLKETTLLNGSILLNITGLNNQKITLSPKDKFVLKDSKYYLTKQSHYTDKDTTILEVAWMQNKLQFKNQTFGYIANDLSRKYDVKVIFKDNAKKAYTYTGEFDKESLEEVLASLNLVRPFPYQKVDKTVYIY